MTFTIGSETDELEKNLPVHVFQYSQTCYMQPLVLTMENGRKSGVAVQSKVDLGQGQRSIVISMLINRVNTY